MADLQNRVDALKGSFKYTTERLGKIRFQIEKLERERLVLEKFMQPINQFEKALLEQRELLELAFDEMDNQTAEAVYQDFERLEQQFSAIDINLFSGEMDTRNAFVDIQSGTGAEVEAQDWADLLLRMYLRWAERHSFEAQILHYSSGEVAGIKSAAIHVVGEYAYGWLRTETGKHRLVRHSPFESEKRRRTSFVEVSVVPEVDEVEIEINPTDLCMNAYRATCAGGPHVNRHESAVRITHLPTNIVVQCEEARSAHKNKAVAIKYLKAKLFDLKRLQCNVAEQSTIENSQPDMSGHSPIRSYVLDKSYIEDLRTGLKTEDVWAVLGGDLDDFIKACLKSGL
jgi:peptide chain release factor 2